MRLNAWRAGVGQASEEETAGIDEVGNSWQRSYGYSIGGVWMVAANLSDGGYVFRGDWVALE